MKKLQFVFIALSALWSSSANADCPGGWNFECVGPGEPDEVPNTPPTPPISPYYVIENLQIDAVENAGGDLTGKLIVGKVDGKISIIDMDSKVKEFIQKTLPSHEGTKEFVFDPAMNTLIVDEQANFVIFQSKGN